MLILWMLVGIQCDGFVQCQVLAMRQRTNKYKDMQKYATEEGECSDMKTKLISGSNGCYLNKSNCPIAHWNRTIVSGSATDGIKQVEMPKNTTGKNTARWIRKAWADTCLVAMAAALSYSPSTIAFLYIADPATLHLSPKLRNVDLMLPSLGS